MTTPETRTLELEMAYWTKALDLVADELGKLKPEDLEARAPKLIAIIRNASYRLSPGDLHACDQQASDPGPPQKQAEISSGVEAAMVKCGQRVEVADGKGYTCCGRRDHAGPCQPSWPTTEREKHLALFRSLATDSSLSGVEAGAVEEAKATLWQAIEQYAHPETWWHDEDEYKQNVMQGIVSLLVVAEARVLALEREKEEKNELARSDQPRVISPADPRDDLKPSSIQEQK